MLCSKCNVEMEDMELVDGDGNPTESDRDASGQIFKCPKCYDEQIY